MSRAFYFNWLIVFSFSLLTYSTVFSTIPELQNSRNNEPGKEGGETIEDAIGITSLPFIDAGYTCDNIDNYTEICPFGGCEVPDIVYSWTSTFDGSILVDLCGSTFDTQLYMYDENLDLIACNDDFYYSRDCLPYVSALVDVPVILDMTYYIVVDGNCDCGDYSILVDGIPQSPPCTLSCPPNSQIEGEPPLVDNYQDSWNAGCNNSPINIQAISAPIFCGVAGWYFNQMTSTRDTDWLECVASESTVSISLLAESSTNLFQLNIPDCDQLSILQSLNAPSCVETTMEISTFPGELVFIWVGSEYYSNPGDVEGNEYNYILTIDGADVAVSTQGIPWDSIKSFYRN